MKTSLWLFFTADYPEDLAVERFVSRFGVTPKKVELAPVAEGGAVVLKLGPVTEENLEFERRKDG